LDEHKVMTGNWQPMIWMWLCCIISPSLWFRKPRVISQSKQFTHPSELYFTALLTTNTKRRGALLHARRHRVHLSDRRPAILTFSWFSSVSPNKRCDSTLNQATTGSFHILSNPPFTVIPLWKWMNFANMMGADMFVNRRCFFMGRSVLWKWELTKNS